MAGLRSTRQPGGFRHRYRPDDCQRPGAGARANRGSDPPDPGACADGNRLTRRWRAIEHRTKRSSRVGELACCGRSQPGCLSDRPPISTAAPSAVALWRSWAGHRDLIGPPSAGAVQTDAVGPHDARYRNIPSRSSTTQPPPLCSGGRSSAFQLSHRANATDLEEWGQTADRTRRAES